MLLFSYILAAALELVMVIITLKMGYLAYAWSFGFLFFLSAASIPLETSKIGKMVRMEFKKLGIDTARYDFLSNIGRIFSYILILINVFNFIGGLISAYGITFIIMIIVIFKYSRIK